MLFKFFLLLSLFSCQQLKMSRTPDAVANMASKSNSNVTGEVQFTDTRDGLKITYKIFGLTKGQTYGFHVHEKGDCSSNDAKSAGKHYMPLALTGGTSKDSPEKHAGDLPQIVATKDVNEGSFVVKEISLKDENPVLGRAVMIHGGPDNIKKKSAPRIACGVISAVE